MTLVSLSSLLVGSQSPRSTLYPHPIELISFSFFFFFFFFFYFNSANSLTKACYLIKGPAMGFDGILTSVFIPLEISPDTNLMKKHSEQWRLDIMPSVTDGRGTRNRGGRKKKNHLFSFGYIFGRGGLALFL